MGEVADYADARKEDVLFGQVLIREGRATPEQVNEALRRQQELAEEGTIRRLGEILVERGRLSSDPFAAAAEEAGARAVAGRYDLQERLGEGGAAEVYRAWDRQLKRPVALKLLRETMAASESLRRRFEREAQTMAGIAHPHVVAVHDAGERDGRLFIAMELVEGRPLAAMLAARQFDLRLMLELLEKAARGVGAAHEKGIVHRDVKPGNILVAKDGTPKVADFGLAHLVGSETGLTKTGSTVGTPLYMAPEQVRGDREITPRTDVYALGAILYEALAGRPPHVGQTVPEVYGKILMEEPVAPRKLNAGAPAEVETIALSAWRRTRRSATRARRRSRRTSGGTWRASRSWPNPRASSRRGSSGRSGTARSRP